jgi:hypothetical protein
MRQIYLKLCNRELQMLEDETSDKLYSSKPRYLIELMLKLSTNIIGTLNSAVPIADILKPT